MAEDAYCPDWYTWRLIAKDLGVKIWELPDVPQYYINITLTALQAEAEAKEAISKQSIPGKK